MCSSYESIKSCIRLLLTSASNGLSLEQLNSDYQYYNQSKNIPYENFGYSTLFDFINDMSDIARIDLNIFPPIVFAVKVNNVPLQSKKKSIKSLNLKTKILSNEKINKRSNKNLKRVVLNQLSNNNLSTDHIIHQLTNLTMNQKSSFNKSLSSYEILTISIDSTTQCQIVQSSNGKYFIPCFELSRLLNINEDFIDKETMFSRIRIYQSNHLFNQFKSMNKSCQHIEYSHQPYFFLILISSIMPVLKMTNYNNQYQQIFLTFQQLFIK